MLVPKGGGGKGNIAAGGVRRVVCAVSLACAAVLLCASSASAQSSLKSRRDIPVGAYPVAALIVDYDGDGNLDVVVVGNGADTLDLVKGFGDGTLRRVGALVASSVPSAAAFVDLNHDGRGDFVVANKRSQDLAVRLGDGIGGYGAAIRSVVAAIPSALAVGDWNGDGRIDAATANPSQNNVTVLDGDGTGRFVTPRALVVGTQPEAILTADFDADGRADLAVVNYGSDSVQVWRGDGAGGFTLRTTLTTGDMPNAAAAADFNGDGRIDLAIGSYGADSVAVHAGDGSGGFGAPLLLSPGFGPRAVTATDINLDGRIDLLVGLSKVSGVGELAVLAGNGAGGFAAPVRIGSGPAPTAIVVGDLNNDGIPDVVSVNKIGNSVSVFQNTGGGLFRIADRVKLADGTYPHDVAVADFNRDGRLDVATPSEAYDHVARSLGQADGSFAAPVTFGQTGTTPVSIVARDLNGDGAPEILTANNGNDTISILVNNGAGSFSMNNGLRSECVGVAGIAAGEISGDAYADINYICDMSNQVCARRGTGTTGNSAFGTQVCALLSGSPAAVAMTHVNGDALEDAAVSQSGVDGVAYIQANGAGGFAGSPVVHAAGSLPRGLARGDLDGDGDLDVVVANSGSGTLSILPGGNPSGAVQVAAGLAPAAVALADFNQDGHPDIVAVNANANNVTLLLGDGTLRFTRAGEFGTGDLPLAIAAGDFNRDGRPDLVVADHFAGTLSVLINESMPEPDPLGAVTVLPGTMTVLRWGTIPGASFDVVRASISAIRRLPDRIDLGAVTCIANDIAESDTASTPDGLLPALGNGFIYLLRATIAGVPGAYSVSTDGRPLLPASGDCP